MIEADEGGLGAAHGEAGDGALCAVAGHVVVLFDLGHDFFNDGAGVSGNHVGAHGAAGSAGVAVTQGIDHDHGLGFALGDQVIENDVGGADVDPGAGFVAEAVEQVEDGVRLFAFRDRSWRGCRPSSRGRRRRWRNDRNGG